jgi:DNA-binding PadR family transcriptional regulator
MRRNVHYFFPRAESQVYAEPKRLVKMGLARAEKEMTGRRSRTVYAITEAGRAELRRWLSEPRSKAPLLEFEGLLRVFLAPFGSTKDLEATLYAARKDMSELLELADRIRDEYLNERAPFQHYVLTRSMVHDFLLSFAELVDEWSERSAARVARWEDQSEAARRKAALNAFRPGSRRSDAQKP